LTSTWHPTFHFELPITWYLSEAALAGEEPMIRIVE